MLNKAFINLKTLQKNAEAVKKKLNAGVKFCAVVKADAYGHGAEEVANALYKTVDCYAVALLEEGVALRRCGIDKDVLCLTPFNNKEVDRAVDFDLTATISNLEQLKTLERAAKKQNKLASVHLKYNTGMNRQGIDGLKKLKEIIEYTLNLKHVKLDGLYSHLYAPENKKALLSQVNKFLLANNLIKGYNNNVTCHISASGGFLAGVKSDMVRIGLLLYGYKPFESPFVKVAPVMKVFAPVIEKRALKKGDCALYGGLVADKNTELSLVRYGYADGLFRKDIDGQFNNRCMDLTAVTAAKKTKYGYTVMENADILAEKYGTISYEILTKSAIRAEKIYIR